MLSMPNGPTVTIANGGTDSPAMLLDDTISDSEHVAIYSPAGLAETCSVQLSYDFDRDYKAHGLTLAAATAAATWIAAPTAIALAAAGGAVIVPAENFTAIAWRIHSAAGVAADRTFIVVKRAWSQTNY